MALKTHSYRYFKDGSAQSSWGSSNQLFVGKDGGGNYVMEVSFELTAPATSVSITILAAGQNEATQYGYKYRLSTVETDSNLINATSSTDGDGPFTLSSGKTGSGTLTVNSNFKANTPYYVYIFTGYAGVYNKSAIAGQSSAYSVTDVASYTLSTSVGTGANLTVNRTSSAYAGTGNLGHGAALYPQDQIQLSFSAQSGYVVTTHTLNGNNFNNNSVIGVSGNISVAVAAIRKYELSISAGTGSSITVNRTSSPVGSTGNLANGSKLYHGDKLQITFTPLSTYEIDTHTVNGSPFASGSIHTVAAAVSVVATAKRQGLIYLDTGSAMVPCQCYLDTGTELILCLPYLETGADWALLA